jgi:hypothetical protein
MTMPIDPTDVDGVARLRGAYLVALKNGTGEWQAWEAVAARAKKLCVPDGHVAVPIDDFRVMFENFMPVFSSPEMAARWYRMKALLPVETEATR